MNTVRSTYQVYRVVAPVKNCETGEFCEDIISIKCSSSINDETGEAEELPKHIFKVPSELQRQLEIDYKNECYVAGECKLCKKGRTYFVLMLITLTFLLPKVFIFLYLGAESLLHVFSHKYDNKSSNRTENFRSLLHTLFYSQFCGFCQAKRSMDRVGKLQDERLAKMRKYVKNIPIQ